MSPRVTGAAVALADELRPRVLPMHWAEHMRLEDGSQYVSVPLGLAAILSVAEEQDGRLWAHLSISHRRRVPSYEELCTCKRLFLGDRKAVQLFVPESEHVNIHPNVLHLWCCLNGDPLPDFRGFINGVATI